MKKALKDPFYLTVFLISIVIISYYFVLFTHGNKYGGLLQQNNEISFNHYEKTLQLKEDFPEFIEGQKLISSSFEDQIITYEEYNNIRDLFIEVERKAKSDKLTDFKFKLNS